MIKSGLVSITFRELDVEEIIRITKEAGLQGIEWGVDIHVPVGDLKRAEKVKKLMEENNLVTSAYGTYYRVGMENKERMEDILETAKVLDTNIVRVWGGKKSYENYSELEKKGFIEDLKRIGRLAKNNNMDISFEYHWDTMTHSQEGVKFILENTKGLDNIKLNWQPATNKSRGELLEELEYLLSKKKLSNIHVYHWKGEKPNREMFLLSRGKEVWKEYFDLIENHGYTTWASLEHIRDNSISNYREDTITLKELIEEV